MKALKKTSASVLTAGILSLMAGAPATAEDEQYYQGKELHDQNCTRCHDASMYQREESDIDSLDSLRTQVNACQNNFDLQWWDEDVDAVTHYLNEAYYQFE